MSPALKESAANLAAHICASHLTPDQLEAALVHWYQEHEAKTLRTLEAINQDLHNRELCAASAYRDLEAKLTNARAALNDLAARSFEESQRLKALCGEGATLIDELRAQLEELTTPRDWQLVDLPAPFSTLQAWEQVYTQRIIACGNEPTAILQVLRDLQRGDSSD